MYNKIINENLFEFRKGLDPIDSLGLGRRAMIEEWLKLNFFTEYRINDDYTIDLFQNMHAYQLTEGKLPEYIKFNKINGNIDITNRDITSLEGFPKKIIGYITLMKCNLKSLIGIPEIDGNRLNYKNFGYDLKNNKLTNFIGLPKIVKGSLWISGNPLNSLDGLPEKIWGNMGVSPDFYEKFSDEIMKKCKIQGSLYQIRL